MITTVYPSSHRPVVDSVFIDTRFVFGSRRHSDFVRQLLCLTIVTAAKARDAREMYSVSIVSFGAEIGRPLMRLMFSKSHNITKRFSIQMFRDQISGVDCATDLFDPELLVLLFLLQPKVLCLHVCDGADPAAESQPSCCYSVWCRSSREPRVPVLESCWPTRWPHSHSVPCFCTLIPALLSDTTFCVDDQVAKVC